MEDVDVVKNLMQSNAEQKEVISQLIAERDAAFAMSRCECATEDTCHNLVVLHKRIAELEKFLMDTRDKVSNLIIRDATGYYSQAYGAHTFINTVNAILSKPVVK
jgi:hypothetical protein